MKKRSDIRKYRGKRLRDSIEQIIVGAIVTLGAIAKIVQDEEIRSMASSVIGLFKKVKLAPGLLIKIKDKLGKLLKLALRRKVSEGTERLTDKVVEHIKDVQDDTQDLIKLYAQRVLEANGNFKKMPHIITTELLQKALSDPLLNPTLHGKIGLSGFGKKDSLRKRIDSKLKRSIKRPGPATSWEIRRVLGIPDGVDIPKKWVGRVDAQGNVTVWDKESKNPNLTAKSRNSKDLDMMAALGKQSYSGLAGAQQAIQWVGSIINPNKQAIIEKENQTKFDKALSSLSKAFDLVGSVFTAVNGMKEATNLSANTAIKVMNNVKPTLELIKLAMGFIQNRMKSTV